MARLVECVPNFSEGRDASVIRAITEAARQAGATLLDVDMGAAANRTVVTLAGAPAAVEEAAFQAMRVASERIDMTRHVGEHPRLGATDVCPFVPLDGVTMTECIEMARRLGERAGRELQIPVYLYDQAATRPQRASLADIRKGEYEGLAARLADPDWTPDFGPAVFNPRVGATVIGAREVLIAYNVNLNTRERLLASRMAIRMRECGGPARDTDGERLVDPAGDQLKIPGVLKAVRAVGWVIEEYGIAQVSVNLLDYRATPMHVVYDEARRQAALLGVEVTGSEIVGLVPRQALLAAGRHYLEKQGLSPAAPEPDLIHIAVRSLGLSDAKPFVANEKVIEYRLNTSTKTLMNLPVGEFTNRLSADTAVPGGGSVAALCGALGAGLAAMVANLTYRRPDRQKDRPRLKALADEAQSLRVRLSELVDLDSIAFESVMAATRMRHETDDEKALRSTALDAANERATSVPFETLTLCLRVAELALEAVSIGYHACLSDAGSAAAAARAGAEGAFLNVAINLKNAAGSASHERRKLAQERLDQVQNVAAEALTLVRSRL
jgi:glutamate formiminotransferase/formiminotetrahydrofolate cyclodeaminase